MLWREAPDSLLILAMGFTKKAQGGEVVVWPSHTLPIFSHPCSPPETAYLPVTTDQLSVRTHRPQEAGLHRAGEAAVELLVSVACDRTA